MASGRAGMSHREKGLDPMTQQDTAPRKSTSLVGSPTAHDLVVELRTRWAAGDPVDTDTLLAQYPELASLRQVVSDLAYEEYCLRRDDGEQVDPDEFAGRFP